MNTTTKTAKKVLQTGYGLGLLTVAQAKRATATLRKELNFDETESIKLAQALVDSSRVASKEVLKTVDQELSKVLVNSGLVSKTELAVMKKAVSRKVRSLRPQKKTVFHRLKAKMWKRK